MGWCSGNHVWVTSEGRGFKSRTHHFFLNCCCWCVKKSTNCKHFCFLLLFFFKKNQNNLNFRVNFVLNSLKQKNWFSGHTFFFCVGGNVFMHFSIFLLLLSFVKKPQLSLIDCCQSVDDQAPQMKPSNQLKPKDDVIPLSQITGLPLKRHSTGCRAMIVQNMRANEEEGSNDDDDDDKATQPNVSTKNRLKRD